MKKQIIFPVCFFIFLSTLCLFGQQAETEELFPIRQNGKWGYINRSGKIVIEPQFMQIIDDNYIFNYGWSEGLAPVRFNTGLWGYIDKTGAVVIKPQFATAARFSEGLARVQSQNEWLVGYINKTGEVVIPYQYCFPGDFKEGLAYMSIMPGCFIDSHMKEDRRTDYGYIDKTGKTVISKLGRGEFSEGLASVWVNGKVGFIDKQGKMIIKPKFQATMGFKDGLAEVLIKGKIVFIDRTGKVVIAPTKGYDINCCHYSEGMTTVITKDRKYGYINKNGQIVIEARFHGAKVFSEGLAAVNLWSDGITYSGGKWGYIDKTGKVIIDFKFDEAEPFFGGLALVGNPYAGETGYIDKTGKYIWKPTE